MPPILLIGIALALDAFGVSLGVGCGKRLTLSEKALIVISFSFFQFFFALAGALLGGFIDTNLFSITGYISGGIIFLLGVLLFREGYKNEEECIYRKLDFWTYIILGISVSIDALGIGFSVLYDLDLLLISSKSIIIGIVTMILTISSFLIVNYIKQFGLVEKYADYIGGTILIIFGLKMLI